ncbi:hypothetical protein [Ornithinimicrobium kibberense]|uniref:hypothetical protein n=1 Tax=Ornithinimicrobium kibberense TaxID=282060 RepID=UPI003608E9FE
MQVVAHHPGEHPLAAGVGVDADPGETVHRHGPQPVLGTGHGELQVVGAVDAHQRRAVPPRLAGQRRPGPLQRPGVPQVEVLDQLLGPGAGHDLEPDGGVQLLDAGEVLRGQVDEACVDVHRTSVAS